MNQRSNPGLISALTIRGYKSLHERTTIPLGGLTILAGANSSGKSSAIEPLLLLKQTLDSSSDPGALLIDGPNVSYTSFAAQMLSRTGKNRDNAIEIGIENPGSKISVQYSKPHLGNIGIDCMVVATDSAEMRVTLGMSSDDIAQRLLPSIRAQADGFAVIYSNRKPLFQVVRDRCFLQVELTGKELGFELPLIQPIAVLSRQIRSLIHVPALRYNSDRLQSVLAAGNSFPGEFDDYVASLIYHWQRTDKARLRHVYDDLRKLGLIERITAAPVSDVEISLQVNRAPKSRDMVELEDVGFGVSQVLPVVVALWAASPGQLVYVEEPESHLHPRAQFALASVIAEAVKRDIRVVVETHSQLFLLGIQSLVASDELDPSVVALHWFSRAANGQSVVDSSGLSETGTFGDWPVDFSDVSLMAERRYLESFRNRAFSRKP